MDVTDDNMDVGAGVDWAEEDAGVRDGDQAEVRLQVGGDGGGDQVSARLSLEDIWSRGRSARLWLVDLNWHWSPIGQGVVW